MPRQALLNKLVISLLKLVARNAVSKCSRNFISGLPLMAVKLVMLKRKESLFARCLIAYYHKFGLALQMTETRSEILRKWDGDLSSVPDTSLIGCRFLRESWNVPTPKPSVFNICFWQPELSIISQSQPIPM